jgi:DNA-binding transcriptional LysR family regulator
VIAAAALTNFQEDEVDVAIHFGGGPWPPHVQMFRREYFPVASPALAAATQVAGPAQGPHHPRGP